MKHNSTLTLLMLMVVFSPLAIDIYLPALPIMAQELSVDITQMQLSISVFILCLGFLRVCTIFMVVVFNL